MHSAVFRILFSDAYFLMPAYFFALVISPNLNESKLLWSFGIIHLLLYPASNGLCFFDAVIRLKTSGKILGYATLLLSGVMAVVLGWFYINEWFALLLFLYGALKWIYTRNKTKRGVYAEGLIAGLLQGAFVFFMSYTGINSFALTNLLHIRVIVPGLLVALLVMVVYSITVNGQQPVGKDTLHYTETAREYRNVFFFVTIGLILTTGVFQIYFYHFFLMHYGVVFVLALLPAVGYYLAFMFRNKRELSCRAALGFNFLWATGLNVFFVWLFLKTSHILQL